MEESESTIRMQDILITYGLDPHQISLVFNYFNHLIAMSKNQGLTLIDILSLARN